MPLRAFFETLVLYLLIIHTIMLIQKIILTLGIITMTLVLIRGFYLIIKYSDYNKKNKVFYALKYILLGIIKNDIYKSFDRLYFTCHYSIKL